MSDVVAKSHTEGAKSAFYVILPQEAKLILHFLVLSDVFTQSEPQLVLSSKN